MSIYTADRRSAEAKAMQERLEADILEFKGKVQTPEREKARVADKSEAEVTVRMRIEEAVRKSKQEVKTSYGYG